MSDEAAPKQNIKTDLKPTPVTVLAQYVKDFSFENPNAPTSLRASNAKPEMDVNITIDAVKINDDQNPDLYETALTLKVKSMRDGQVMFIGEVVYAALVGLKSVPAEYIKAILYIEVPAMLFPFARQQMAEATAAGGFPPLLLNPVDFRGMFENSQKLDKDAIAAA